MRYVSAKMGSRNAQTTIYWLEDNIQVVCGCFKGTIDEFLLKVKETHGDNVHAKSYLYEIDTIKMIIERQNNFKV